MHIFKRIIVSGLWVILLLQISGSVAMEKDDDIHPDPMSQSVNTAYLSTPFSCFSLKKKTLSIREQETQSLFIRKQWVVIKNWSNSHVPLTSTKVKETYQDLKACAKFCKIWKHPAQDLFLNMKTLLKSNYTSPSDRTVSVNQCLIDFLETLDTMDHLDALEMKLFFMPEYSEMKRQSSEVVMQNVYEISDILMHENRVEIVLHYAMKLGYYAELRFENPLDYYELAVGYGYADAKKSIMRYKSFRSIVDDVRRLKTSSGKKKRSHSHKKKSSKRSSEPQEEKSSLSQS